MRTLIDFSCSFCFSTCFDTQSSLLRSINSGAFSLSNFCYLAGNPWSNLDTSTFWSKLLHLYLCTALLWWPICSVINCSSTLFAYNLLAVVALRLLLLKLPTMPAFSIIVLIVKLNTFLPTREMCIPIAVIEILLFWPIWLRPQIESWTT